MKITKKMMMACTPVRTAWSGDHVWRFDYFHLEENAVIWAARRQKEGCRLTEIQIRRVRHTAPGFKQWYVASKHGIHIKPKPFYPKVKYNHCRHCDERITLVRMGQGGRVKQEYLAKRGVKNYQYVEDPIHSCPGRVKEREQLKRTQEELNKFFGRVLKPRKSN